MLILVAVSVPARVMVRAVDRVRAAVAGCMPDLSPCGKWRHAAAFEIFLLGGGSR